MTRLWVLGLARRRGGRLAVTSVGIALAVALLACLGSFLTSAQATMTARAAHSVAVDWQVQLAAGADLPAVVTAVKATPGVAAAETVQFTATSSAQATVAGSTQTTGPGVLVGLPAGYRTAFPAQIRQLTGSGAGVQIAQQTASNLHVQPGDSVTVALPGRAPTTVRIDGVVDLPQADTLFQKVGAPSTSQPSAPPDNVILVPDTAFAAASTGAANDPSTSASTSASAAAPTGASPAAVTVQLHVRRDAPLPADPAGAYESDTGAARNLEAHLTGTVTVGDNLGSALAAARSDAAYAQMLFLFLGVPGALVAALLTAALVAAGTPRRQQEQALLRIRGLTAAQIGTLAAAEAMTLGVIGGIVGVGVAWVAASWAFPVDNLALTSSLTPTLTLAWLAAGLVVGVLIALTTVLWPALRSLRATTVTGARAAVGRARSPWWMRAGVDVMVLAAAGVVFWASSSNNYTLVLAPDGVPTVSVSYWAFLGPALLWVGAAMLLARVVSAGLEHGRAVLTRLATPLTGRMASTAAASMSRQRRTVTRSVVLLALAVSFGASTATFNATYRQQAEADAQLTNGADVTVTASGAAAGVPPASSAVIAATTTAAADAATARTIGGVAGVQRVEPIQHRFAYVGSDLQDLYGVHPRSIGSVTALQDPYFGGGSAAALMNTLAQYPDSILVSDETVKDFQLQPGDLVNLRLQDRATQALTTVPFHYVGTVKEFPTAPKDSFFVANADYVARATGNPAVGAWLVDTGGSNQASVAQALRQQLGTNAAVTDITSTRSTVGSSLTSVNLSGLTRLELAFAVLLAAAAAGLVLAVGLAERRRALAIIALLGARTRQLRGFVIAEAAVVLIAGLAGAAVISWGLSQMLIRVLTGVFDPPPSAAAVPWGYLAGTASAVVAASVIAATVVASITTGPAITQLRDL
jgi:putative ABC transport system permease protein